MMGGVGSWATLAKFVGADVAISAVASRFEPKSLIRFLWNSASAKGVRQRTERVCGLPQRGCNGTDRRESAYHGGQRAIEKKIPVMDFNFFEVDADAEVYPFPNARTARTP